MDLLAVIFGIAVLAALLAIGTRIAVALGVAGLVIAVQAQGAGNAFETLIAVPFNAVARYAWIVIPLFVLMGLLAAHGGLAKDLFDLLARLLRRVPGGLGIATVAACAGFAAISGSSLATAATVGRLAIGEMVRRGYPKTLAGGLVAAAGTLGVLIPPSIVLVMYAVVTGESVGDLLVAGVIPGLLSALSYAALVPWLLRRTHRRVAAAVTSADAVGDVKVPSPDPPPAAPDDAHTPGQGRGERGRGVSAAVVITTVFAVILVGVAEGFVTITESAALAVVVVLIAVPVHRFVAYGSVGGTLGAVRAAVREAAATTSMIFAVLVGAALFSYGLVLANVPRTVTLFVSDLPLPPILLVVVLLALVVPLGMFLEPMAILLIVAPLVHPIVTDFGFDGVWLGILLVRTIELGLITPPVGLNAFVVARSSPEVDVASVFRGIVPFAFADVATIGLLIAFPPLVLWLPSML